MRKYITSSKLLQPTQLNREQKRVYETLIRVLGMWPLLAVTELSGDILTTGTSQFTEFPVTMDCLPRGVSWGWRQSNARVTVQVDISTIATIVKVNTKKIPGFTEKPPSYKFWIVQLELPCQSHLWFLHCERGLEPLPRAISTNTPTETINLFPSVSENELSFLDELLHPPSGNCSACFEIFPLVPPYLL